MLSTIVFTVIAVVCPCKSDDDANNIVVSTRLVSLHPKYTKKFVSPRKKRGLDGYRDIKLDECYQPKPESIRLIDLELGKYLKHVSTNHPNAKKLKNFSSGIDRISKIRHKYCAQFLGVTNTKNEKHIICIYSLVEDDVDAFHTLKYVPYFPFQDGENFIFSYDPKTKRKFDFHIEGTLGTTFGE